MTLDELARDIQHRSSGSQRFIVAIAGAPGSGKSTMADQLADAMRALGETVAVIPMDGFHMDNAVLIEKGLLAQKGAPETFDVRAFCDIVEALRDARQEVLVPVFDRSREIAIASARAVSPLDRILLVEGNYLLLNENPWSNLSGKFDFTIFLDVPENILEERLWHRWNSYNLDHDTAHGKIHGNDLPNGRRIKTNLLPVDLFFTQQ
jgi:pantothenate kinase